MAFLKKGTYTQEMKDNEAALFLKIAMKNGSDADEAIKDMQMIDTLLAVPKLYLAVKANITKTAKGNIRKNSNLYHLMHNIIDGRLKLDDTDN